MSGSVNYSEVALERIKDLYKNLSPQHLRELKDLVDAEFQFKVHNGFMEKVPRKRNPKQLEKIAMKEMIKPWGK